MNMQSVPGSDFGGDLGFLTDNDCLLFHHFYAVFTCFSGSLKSAASCNVLFGGANLEDKR